MVPQQLTMAEVANIIQSLDPHGILMIMWEQPEKSVMDSLTNFSYR